MITRRRFVSGLATGATAGLAGMRPGPASAEPPPETRKLALARSRSICQAPQYVAKGLLESEGFTDVQYIRDRDGVDAKALATGKIQITLTFAGPLIVGIDAGDPVVLLGGGHIGCIELFGHERVRTVRDLKGKTVVVGRGRDRV